jgi:hypothetical protein
VGQLLAGGAREQPAQHRGAIDRGARGLCVVSLRRASGGGFELDYARARSRYESFADYFDQSIRSATNERFAGSMWHRSGFTGSLEYRKEHVLRSLSDEFDAHAHSLWGTFGWSGVLGAGRLDATLGAGTHQALDNKLYPAPSVSYEVQGNGFTARAGIERVLHAQWVDLVLDVNPFLQSTWAGVLDLNLGSTPQRHARLTYLAGRTRDRIIINRTPLEEFALRTGAFPDPISTASGCSAPKDIPSGTRCSSPARRSF